MSPDIKPGIAVQETTFPGRKIILPSGLDSLSADLSTSGGRAAVIVHPYYRQHDVDRGNLDEVKTDQYHRYVENLAKAVEIYRRARIPIILFETAANMESIDGILSRMHLTDGSIYLVSTFPSSPEPDSIGLNFYELIEQLKESGLERAVAVGSNFWTRKFRDRYERLAFGTKRKPPIASRYKLGGCVGYTINRFLLSEIYTTHGFATFPSPEDRILHQNELE